jgi:hypothetical protein
MKHLAPDGGLQLDSDVRCIIDACLLACLLAFLILHAACTIVCTEFGDPTPLLWFRAKSK